MQVLYGFLNLCFFFSSRRRHTRWPRDWSSDVCSSDVCSSDLAVEDRDAGVGLAELDLGEHAAADAAELGERPHGQVLVLAGRTDAHAELLDHGRAHPLAGGAGEVRARAGDRGPGPTGVTGFVTRFDACLHGDAHYIAQTLHGHYVAHAGVEQRLTMCVRSGARLRPAAPSLSPARAAPVLDPSSRSSPCPRRPEGGRPMTQQVTATAPSARRTDGRLLRWFVSYGSFTVPQAAAPIAFALIALPLTGVPSSGAAMMLAMTLAQVVGAVPVTRFGRRFAPIPFLRALIGVRTVALAAVAVLAGLGAPFSLLVASAAAAGLVNGAAFGHLRAVLNHLVSAGRMPRALGIAATLNEVTFAAAPVIASGLGALSPQAAIWAMVVLGAGQIGRAHV